MEKIKKTLNKIIIISLVVIPILFFISFYISLVGKYYVKVTKNNKSDINDMLKENNVEISGELKKIGYHQNFGEWELYLIYDGFNVQDEWFNDGEARNLYEYIQNYGTNLATYLNIIIVLLLKCIFICFILKILFRINKKINTKNVHYVFITLFVILVIFSVLNNIKKNIEIKKVFEESAWVKVSLKPETTQDDINKLSKELEEMPYFKSVVFVPKEEIYSGYGDINLIKDGIKMECYYIKDNSGNFDEFAYFRMMEKELKKYECVESVSTFSLLDLYSLGGMKRVNKYRDKVKSIEEREEKENNSQNSTQEPIVFEDDTEEYVKDDNFYIENGNLYILDYNKKPIQVPGNFSEMKETDYNPNNHQSMTNKANAYFYYIIDERIYLVISQSIQDGKWLTIDITENEYTGIGIPKGSKIKNFIVNGSFGYIFYIRPDGVGKVLKSSTKGEYWSEVKTNFVLNQNCKLKFLNQYGMTIDGYITVPSNDGEKCDLYRVDNYSQDTIEKVEINYDKSKDYFLMPTYLDNNGMAVIVEVKNNKNDTNIVKYISGDNGVSWKTEEEFYNEKKKNEDTFKQLEIDYDKQVDKLDQNYFLINFNNYNVKSNEIKISEEKAKEIAEIGFKEAGARIASEGVTDTVSESVVIDEVVANNFFTRKYNQGDKSYTNIKRKAYIFKKENYMGNGVNVYVDVNSGLIIGGRAFGD